MEDDDFPIDDDFQPQEIKNITLSSNHNSFRKSLPPVRPIPPTPPKKDISSNPLPPPPTVVVNQSNSATSSAESSTNDSFSQDSNSTLEILDPKESSFGDLILEFKNSPLKNQPEEIVVQEPKKLISEDEMVELCVGGKKFLTTFETLTFDKDNYFEKILALKTENDENQKIKKIFIDRNGTYFEYILDYMREKGDFAKFYLPRDDKVAMENIRRDAVFYGLKGLLKIIDNETIRSKILKTQDLLDIFENIVMKEPTAPMPITAGAAQISSMLENAFVGLPVEYKFHKRKLIYSSVIDGHSANAFKNKVDCLGFPTICLIKSNDGTIFGGFCNTNWNQEKEGVALSDNPKGFVFSLNDASCTSLMAVKKDFPNFQNFPKPFKIKCEKIYRDRNQLFSFGGRMEFLKKPVFLDFLISVYDNRKVLTSIYGQRREYKADIIEVFALIP